MPARASKIDAAAEYPADVHAAFAEAGLLSAVVPAGAAEDASAWEAAAVVEEVARACGGCALMLMIARLAALPILIAGGKEQKEAVLPKLASGRLKGAFAITEQGAGSDVGAMTTRAATQPGGWVLSGVKSWISNAPVADVAVVFAMSDPGAGSRGVTAFLVDLRQPGIRIGAATAAAMGAILVGIGLARFAFGPEQPALVSGGWFSACDAALMAAANFSAHGGAKLT